MAERKAQLSVEPLEQRALPTTGIIPPPITIPPFIPAPVPAELLQISKANNSFQSSIAKLEASIAHDLITHHNAAGALKQLHKLVDSFASEVRALTGDILKDSGLSEWLKADVHYIRHLTGTLEHTLNRDIEELGHDIHHDANITTDLAKVVDIQNSVTTYEVEMHD